MYFAVGIRKIRTDAYGSMLMELLSRGVAAVDFADSQTFK